MYKIFVCSSLFLALASSLYGSSFGSAAFSPADTLEHKELKEVIVIAPGVSEQHINKPLASLEQYLEGASAVDMVRRGAYAWEAQLFGLSPERNTISIDGMRVFPACTDRMDPITSYLEIGNLSQVTLSGPSDGGKYAGSISGSLELHRKGSSLGANRLSGNIQSGFETNNNHKIIGGSLEWQSPRFASRLSGTYRKAENYLAGGGRQIDFSQFSKANFSANLLYHISDRHELEGDFIYDDARDIGYPSLAMDVSSAQGVIGSVSYTYRPKSGSIKSWESKLYANTITHIMDDSKRPDVPIRMDMPGWSDTYGFYSQVKLDSRSRSTLIHLSGYHNRARAEMTMFSPNSQEKDMFMLTWPGVYTSSIDLYFEQAWRLDPQRTLKASLGGALQNNRIYDDFGLESLRVFYPDLGRDRLQGLPRLAIDYMKSTSRLSYTLGVSYNTRAASISEGYGFYLFNTQDLHDYIGNPILPLEKSISSSLNLNYAMHPKIELTGSLELFHIKDYILGITKEDMSAMSMSAEGVKRYESLAYANLGHANIQVNWKVVNGLEWQNRFTYIRGKAENFGNLPFIAPASMLSTLKWMDPKWVGAEVTWRAQSAHRDYSSSYGEEYLKGYHTFDASLSRNIKVQQKHVLVKVGVENLMDKYYTTFADWNRIARMGRNFYANLIWHF